MRLICKNLGLDQNTCLSHLSETISHPSVRFMWPDEKALLATYTYSKTLDFFNEEHHLAIGHLQSYSMPSLPLRSMIPFSPLAYPLMTKYTHTIPL